MTSFVDMDEDIDPGFDVQLLTDKLHEAVCDSESCPFEACVNLSVTHSEEVRKLNLEYRDMDRTTDVLSFPATEVLEGRFEELDQSDISLFDPESGELILGDIIINIDRVYSQAEEYGHGIKREFAFLAAHCLFHLCGYDHMDDETAHMMEEKQEAVLQKLGITREGNV